MNINEKIMMTLKKKKKPERVEGRIKEGDGQIYTRTSLFIRVHEHVRYSTAYLEMNEK